MVNLDAYGLSASRLIAGFAGGLVYAFVIKEREPWAVVGSVVVGTLTANFLSSAVGHYLPDWFGSGGIAFFTGLSAMALCQGLIFMTKARLRAMKDENP